MVPEKVSEPVSVKFGIGKKSRNRYREDLDTSMTEEEWIVEAEKRGYHHTDKESENKESESEESEAGVEDEYLVPE